jgi:hypothetical protein
MHNFHIGPTLFLLKTPTYLNGLSETKQFIRLIEIMSTYLGLTLTLTVRYENYAFRTREQYMTIIKFEWSPLDRCYDIPPFYINKKNELCTDYLDIFIIHFTFFASL